MNDKSSEQISDAHHVIALEILLTALIRTLHVKKLLEDHDFHFLEDNLEAALQVFTDRSETSFQITGERVRIYLKALMSTVR